MAVAIASGATDGVDYGDIAALAGVSGLSVAITLLPDSPLAGGSYVASQWGNAGPEQGFLLQVNTSGRIFFGLKTGEDFATTFSGKQTGDSVVAGATRSKIVATWAGGSDIHIYHNGTDESLTEWLGSAAGATYFDASASVDLGEQTDVSSDPIDADYSEFGIWGRTLTADEANAYCLNYAPTFFRDSLLVYSRLTNTVDINDIAGGIAGTGSGLANADHPPMIYPASPKAMPWVTAAVGGGTILPFMNHYAA